MVDSFISVDWHFISGYNPFFLDTKSDIVAATFYDLGLPLDIYSNNIFKFHTHTFVDYEFNSNLHGKHVSFERYTFHKRLFFRKGIHSLNYYSFFSMEPPLHLLRPYNIRDFATLGMIKAIFNVLSSYKPHEKLLFHNANHYFNVDATVCFDLDAYRILCEYKTINNVHPNNFLYDNFLLDSSIQNNRSHFFILWPGYSKKNIISSLYPSFEKYKYLHFRYKRLKFPLMFDFTNPHLDEFFQNFLDTRLFTDSMKYSYHSFYNGLGSSDLIVSLKGPAWENEHVDYLFIYFKKVKRLPRFDREMMKYNIFYPAERVVASLLRLIKVNTPTFYFGPTRVTNYFLSSSNLFELNRVSLGFTEIPSYSLEKEWFMYDAYPSEYLANHNTVNFLNRPYFHYGWIDYLDVYIKVIYFIIGYCTLIILMMLLTHFLGIPIIFVWAELKPFFGFFILLALLRRSFVLINFLLDLQSFKNNYPNAYANIINFDFLSLVSMIPGIIRNRKDLKKSMHSRSPQGRDAHFMTDILLFQNNFWNQLTFPWSYQFSVTDIADNSYTNIVDRFRLYSKSCEVFNVHFVNTGQHYPIRFFHLALAVYVLNWRIIDSLLKYFVKASFILAEYAIFLKKNDLIVLRSFIPIKLIWSYILHSNNFRLSRRMWRKFLVTYFFRRPLNNLRKNPVFMEYLAYLDWLKLNYFFKSPLFRNLSLFVGNFYTMLIYSYALRNSVPRFKWVAGQEELEDEWGAAEFEFPYEYERYYDGLVEIFQENLWPYLWATDTLSWSYFLREYLWIAFGKDIFKVDPSSLDSKSLESIISFDSPSFWIDFTINKVDKAFFNYLLHKNDLNSMNFTDPDLYPEADDYSEVCAATENLAFNDKERSKFYDPCADYSDFFNPGAETEWFDFFNNYNSHKRYNFFFNFFFGPIFLLQILFYISSVFLNKIVSSKFFYFSKICIFSIFYLLNFLIRLPINFLYKIFNIFFGLISTITFRFDFIKFFRQSFRNASYFIFASIHYFFKFFFKKINIRLIIKIIYCIIFLFVSVLVDFYSYVVILINDLAGFYLGFGDVNLDEVFTRTYMFLHQGVPLDNESFKRLLSEQYAFSRHYSTPSLLWEALPLFGPYLIQYVLVGLDLNFYQIFPSIFLFFRWGDFIPLDYAFYLHGVPLNIFVISYFKYFTWVFLFFHYDWFYHLVDLFNNLGSSIYFRFIFNFNNNSDIFVRFKLLNFFLFFDFQLKDLINFPWVLKKFINSPEFLHWIFLVSRKYFLYYHYFDPPDFFTFNYLIYNALITLIKINLFYEPILQHFLVLNYIFDRFFDWYNFDGFLFRTSYVPNLITQSWAATRDVNLREFEKLLPVFYRDMVEVTNSFDSFNDVVLKIDTSFYKIIYGLPVTKFYNFACILNIILLCIFIRFFTGSVGQILFVSFSVQTNYNDAYFWYKFRKSEGSDLEWLFRDSRDIHNYLSKMHKHLSRDSEDFFEGIREESSYLAVNDNKFLYPEKDGWHIKNTYAGLLLTDRIFNPTDFYYSDSLALNNIFSLFSDYVFLHGYPSDWLNKGYREIADQTANIDSLDEDEIFTFSPVLSYTPDDPNEDLVTREYMDMTWVPTTFVLWTVWTSESLLVNSTIDYFDSFDMKLFNLFCKIDDTLFNGNLPSWTFHKDMGFSNFLRTSPDSRTFYHPWYTSLFVFQIWFFLFIGLVVWYSEAVWFFWADLYEEYYEEGDYFFTYFEAWFYIIVWPFLSTFISNFVDIYYIGAFSSWTLYGDGYPSFYHPEFDEWEAILLEWNGLNLTPHLHYYDYYYLELMTDSEGSGDYYFPLTELSPVLEFPPIEFWGSLHTYDTSMFVYNEIENWFNRGDYIVRFVVYLITLDLKNLYYLCVDAFWTFLSVEVGHNNALVFVWYWIKHEVSILRMHSLIEFTVWIFALIYFVHQYVNLKNTIKRYDVKYNLGILHHLFSVRGKLGKNRLKFANRDSTIKLATFFLTKRKQFNSVIAKFFSE